MPLSSFHAAVAAWFQASFPFPTDCQRRAWPAIKTGSNALIAAPTGSGKTLAAFLGAIDDLVREGACRPLPDETRVLYVSPLKALGNDVQKNLEVPIEGINRLLAERLEGGAPIRTMVRTGDTPPSVRQAMRRCPPHILVTTPESLFILLSSESGRAGLRGVRTLIVDEIHALAGNKRGAHLALSLERLDALAVCKPVRIGLSATQSPIDEVARFLVGAEHVHDGRANCTVVDAGHAREWDLALELPGSPLAAVMSGEVWAEVYDRLAALIQAHRTTLVFVNTRRMAERVARGLSERLGEDEVTSHHGSLARVQRLHAEERLKSGALRALVATASLELGIDVGEVDLVCQLGSTRAISVLLQRVGRAGHAQGRIPRGRLFPLSRDDLVECVALLDAVRRGELDRLHVPTGALDVLAQQIIAMCACEEWSEEALYRRVRAAWPYRGLTRESFTAVVRMLADGFSTRRGRRSAYLYRDAVHGRLRARRGARLTVVTAGGAIPDNADYDVVLEPQGTFLGTLNEDFAIESLAGDIFQLGNSSWRILRIEHGKVRVEDAHGQPPNIPFWLGEAPGRSDEHSAAVARLRAGLGARLDPVHGETGRTHTTRWLIDTSGLSEAAATQLVDYLAAARAALGALPDDRTLVLERFFDESGGMQLVIHCALGSRVNRAFGLALRKRFCRRFNFELQAAATEDAIVLSLGETHSFPLEEVARYLHPQSVRGVLVQALLDAPMFTVRWRWNANVSLAVPRFRGGAKVPANIQRMQAEDLVAVVFPDQLACLENIVGERELPDHPLVEQTITDCLTDAMDIDGLLRLLTGLHNGEIRVVARDLTEPSPLAQEVLGARPYAFLDDAPLEERRTRAVQARRWVDPATAADLGRLDPEAIARVRRQAWPQVEDADELHDALCVLGFLTPAEGTRWSACFAELVVVRRAGVLYTPAGAALWVAAERLPELTAVHPGARVDPLLAAPAEYACREWTREEALREMVRARLGGSGPITAVALAAALAVPREDVETALIALEGEGFALRGAFTGPNVNEWCERRLLARIHRHTVQALRREIEPVCGADLLRFLLDWQHLSPATRVYGQQGLASVLEQLDGYEAPAIAWEAQLLPARVGDYDPAWLDHLCLAGRFSWQRLSLPEEGVRAGGPARNTPIAITTRGHRGLWLALAGGGRIVEIHEPVMAKVQARLAGGGAAYLDEITEDTGLARTAVETALAELAATGGAYADAFAGLRALMRPGRRRGAGRGLDDVGRWAALRRPAAVSALDEDALERVTRVLLRRYGVLARALLAREVGLPPWRDLLRVLRRLEARGELRGGRFVAGLSGEQFALPEAVSMLREVRRRPGDGALITLGAADPLNLVGLIGGGARVPALAGHRILLRDGVAVAAYVARELRLLVAADAATSFEFRSALLRPRMTGGDGRHDAGTWQQRPA